MKVSISSTPAQSRQIKQQLANPKESLSYELGKAVQELPPLYTRLLAGGISALVFGTIAWAHFSKIDEVAIAQGQLIPSTEVRPIRAGSVGSIQQINVKEGDQIRKGQVMVIMDSALPQAEVARLTQASKLIREDIARLQAERTGSANAGTQVQDQLLQARLGEFDRKRAAAIDEAQRQLSARDEALATLSRLQANLVNAKDGLANANIREQALSSLKGSGAVPQLDYIRAQDEVTQAKDRVVSYEKEINVQREKIRQAESAYSSAQNTATGLVSQRQSEILTQFTKRQEEQASVEGQLAQAKKQQERETIAAPFDGTVYNVKATRGPVQTGEELVSIVPKDENIVLEVKILNRDIGFIKEGMRAKVKLATFSYQEFGIVEGKVIGVSPNAIVEKDVGLVFPTRIRLNKRAVDVRGQSVNFTPGMQATAEIVTRKKSVLDFMIEPITRRFSEAFSVR
ncbi:HlyD family type I secretion periplasmic adaptor subunit [Phormidium sp. FACHB-592]|uniref:HlyD family type I secretion periplasmic adaptor subunit n=1 Tax=Stenomitos frigidus AS-A4 TaxID=2933935 RepID=A0ABV0KL89_9CYAN|nr:MULTISPECIES: HlyD family type I secretion periplasmic adaptor subunit [Cyanophyceae]MBD2034910.1 HlyD family type I secretion periplasmic adaptor subunit [Leptolyngbya sp. FACHB-321]MBD2073259.1 HlyD family type I secretion periplasmic adaptor subunit [Phormidium sp. FACHB-592]